MRSKNERREAERHGLECNRRIWEANERGSSGVRPYYNPMWLAETIYAALFALGLIIAIVGLVIASK